MHRGLLWNPISILKCRWHWVVLMVWNCFETNKQISTWACNVFSYIHKNPGHMLVSLKKKKNAEDIALLFWLFACVTCPPSLPLSPWPKPTPNTPFSLSTVNLLLVCNYLVLQLQFTSGTWDCKEYQRMYLCEGCSHLQIEHWNIFRPLPYEAEHFEVCK